MKNDSIAYRIERVFQRRYELLDRLGSGGMGMVFLARARDLGRKKYAIKIVDKTSPENKGVDVYAEIQILKDLNHPNIVTIFEALEDDTYVYIVQEFIRGKSLAEIRDNPKYADVVFEDEARLWMIDIAEALAYLHTQGIVHRDVKPGNIMIDADGSARLIDFGIARQVATISRVISGSTIGSAPYSPLERLEGAADGIQTDIYAYGTTFYSLIRRKIPSVSGREINTLRTSNRSVKPYYMNAYRTMINDLENIKDEGIREIIRNCIDIDPRRRVNEFNTIRYLLSSTDEVQAEHYARGREFRKKHAILILLLVSGIVFAGLGMVQMKRDHDHRYDRIIKSADEAYAASDYVMSERKANEAIEFDPNKEAGYFTKYKTITSAANELNERSEYERLIGTIQNDIRKQPSLSDSIYTATYLANAYFETDRQDETIRVLGGRDDLGDEQLLLLGHAMYLNNDIPGANQCLEKMTADIPQRYYLEGLINEKRNTSEALKCYSKVLEADTADSYTGDLKRKALSQITQLYMDQKQYEQAIKTIYAETERNRSLKESIKINLMLLDCFYESGDFVNASDQADVVLNKSNSSHAYAVKTNSLVKLGDEDSALKTIADWETALPNDAMPHIQRAAIYNNRAGAAKTDSERKRTYPEFIKVYEEELNWLTEHNALNDEFLSMEGSYYDALDILGQIEREERV